VENLSLADSCLLQSTSVSAAYGSDVDLVMRLLLEACQQQERVLEDPAAFVTLSNFGADGLDFVAHYWVDELKTNLLTLKSDIHLQILNSFKENGLEIPYPQRVVHMAATSQFQG